jgi:hypothetical protein
MLSEKRYLRGLARKNNDQDNKDKIKRVQDKPSIVVVGSKDSKYDWVMLDSKASAMRRQFGDYVEGIRHNAPYEETFSDILDGITFNQFLNKIFKGRKDLVGIDIGGPGTNFFGSLSGKLFKKTFGLTLGDHVPIRLKMGIEEENKNHSVLYGNVYDKSVRSQVVTKTGDKIDFVVSRMGAGYDLAPDNPFTLFETLNDFYKMLSDCGVMMIQLPSEHVIIMYKWLNLLQSTTGLEVKIGDSKFGNVMFLQKTKDSLLDLPKLHRREILSVPKVGI